MVRGKAAPTTFHNAATGTRCVVHSDDFAFVGQRKDLQRMTQLIKAWYQIKVRDALGSGANDDMEMSLLNRLVRWKSDSIEVEADSKHRWLIMEHFGMEEETNVFTAPAIKEDVGGDEGELTKEESTGYRRVAARANSDIQFAVKEACRGMFKPSEGQYRRMKRLARYLKGAKAATVVGSMPSEGLSFTSTAIGPDARRPASRLAKGW